MAKPKVFIGVGHGGKDPGAVSNGITERDIALKCASELKRILNLNGIRAKRSRKSNTVSDPVQDEAKECNDYDPVLTVEIHFNSALNKNAHGFECFYTSNTGREIAECIEKKVVNIGQYSRGCKLSKNLYYLNHTKAPAVLLEGEFVSYTGYNYFCTDAGIKKLAKAYADGIMEFLKIKGVI